MNTDLKFCLCVASAVLVSWGLAAHAYTPPTPEERELYQIAIEAQNPEYCYTLEKSDYQMYCRVITGDIGASCSQIQNARIRGTCTRLTTEPK